MLGGQGTGGGGFNFTQPAPTGGAPGTGFSFGAPNTTGTAGAPPPAGFSFRAPGPTTTAAAPAPGAAGGGGFSFGNFGGNAGGGGLAGGFGGLGSSAATATTAAPAAASGAGLSGFNFGAAPNKPAATAAPTAGGFGLGASTTTAAPPGFSFGGGTSSGVGGTTAGFTGLGGNVNASAKTGLPGAVPTASTAPGGISFGTTAAKSTAAAATSSLGALLSSTQPASLPTASTTAATGFSLGGASTGAPISSAPPGFSFGTSLGQTSTAATTAATSAGGGLGLSGFAATTATTSVGGGLGLTGFAPTTTPSGAATSTVAVPTLPGGQKQMSFRQLEDTINKWTTELEEQEKCFLDQATQVNAWDRIVMENGEKIITLNKDLERVKLDQQKLDHELDFVHSQQRELEDLLTPLEAALDELPPISHTQHAQLEREHTYTLAESLDSQLKRMSQDLKEIVERLNSTNMKPDDNDPLQQITKILNAHVVSLMWVDRNSANLQRRAEEIAKMMDSEKKEQERNFRMAYS